VCKAMEDMRDEAARQAEEKTILATIKNLMLNTKWSAEKAMEMMGIPSADQGRYSELPN